MNQASFFIEKKALFGGYPSHKQITELVNEGVVWFIDLTNHNEKGIRFYSHLVHNWINFPIKDGHIPENNKKFVIFLFILQMVLNNLKPGEKLYLHCKGGHGRSCLVISCLLCMVFNLPPIESLNLIKNYHSLRPNLKAKWLSRWPLSIKQRNFVESFFGTLYFYSNFKSDNIKEITTIKDFINFMVVLNVYLQQNEYMLNVLLHSGFKTLKGEGTTSVMLQKLRFFLLYTKAKKIFDND